jgi:hypothetical protein
MAYSAEKSAGFGMKSTFRLAAGILGVAALVLQYVLVLTGQSGPDAVRRTINFFSYFTILTNVLVVLAFLGPTLLGETAVGRFFAGPRVRTAIAIYIIIVSALVFFILRHLANLQGLDYLCDFLLHYILPALFVVDWVFFVSKAELQWRDMLGWLWYPVIYLAWTFVHGALSGFYPYPFLNTEVLGVGRVLLNELGLLAMFLVLGLVLISLGRLGLTSKSPLQ